MRKKARCFSMSAHYQKPACNFTFMTHGHKIAIFLTNLMLSNLEIWAQSPLESHQTKQDLIGEAQINVHILCMQIGPLLFAWNFQTNLKILWPILDWIDSPTQYTGRVQFQF